MSNTLEYILSIRDGFSPTLNKLNNGANNSTKNLNAMTVALGNMYSSAMRSLAGIGTQIFDAVYNGTVKREQDIAGLFTFVGDRATEVYRNIQKDASVTPFDTQSLLDVNMALISAGVNADAARKDALNLGNAISAAGKGNAELSRMAANMQQIKTVGKASAMDIKQFGMAGINIYELLHRATGKSIKDVKDMDVSYELLSKALDMAAKKGGVYDGALARQGKTLGAMMESAKDTAGIAFADFGDMLRPLFEKGLIYLQKFVDKLPGMLESARPFIMVIGNAFFWVVDALITAGRFVKGLWQSFLDGNPVVTFLATLVAVITAYQIIIQIAALKTALWEGAQWMLNAALAANPLGLIIAAIIALIALIGWVIYKTDGWGEAWKHTVQGAKLLWDWFVASGKNMFNGMIDAFMIGLNRIKTGWYEFKNAVGVGDTNANNAMLAQINADTQARKKAIVDGNKESIRLGVQALSEFGKAGGALHWNNKGMGDIKNDILNKIGVHSGIPGANVKSDLGDTSKGGKSGKSAQSVATGGQKNVTVNVSISQLAQGWQIKVDNLEEGVDRFRDRLMDEMTRIVSMGAALGGEN